MLAEGQGFVDTRWHVRVHCGWWSQDLGGMKVMIIVVVGFVRYWLGLLL